MIHHPSPAEPASLDVAEEDAERQRLAAVRALRRFVNRHNWHVLALAFFSLVTTVILWGLLYVFTYWSALVALTISKSFNAGTLLEVNDPHLVGTHFPWWFLGGAVAFLTVARIVRGKLRVDGLREARHYFLWVVAELLMAVPNVTFSVWGNLRALVRMPFSEAAEAWRLLEKIDRAGGRLTAASLRLEIEDERRLQRVVFALQLVGLVDLRERREGWYLCLDNRDAFALLSQGTLA